MECLLSDYEKYIQETERGKSVSSYFGDVNTKEKKRIDIMAKVKAFGEPSAILIHIEPQSYRQEQFIWTTFATYVLPQLLARS